MSTKLLQGIGALAILLLAVSSFTALALVQERIEVSIAPGKEGERLEADPVALVAADVAGTREDLRALAGGMGKELASLHGAIEELKSELARRDADGEDSSKLLSAEPRITAAEVAPDETPAPAAASAPEIEPAVRPKKSFLAFELPSTSFAPDRRWRFAVVPSLSRVGFDAKSTLHDFSGVSSRIEGTLVACLARPGEQPGGALEMEAASLDTGMEARDAEMRARLEIDRHPRMRFEWTGFEPREVRPDAVEGTARGTLSIHGVDREFSMPVRVVVDASHRVRIEGETRVKMSGFGIEPPRKLGLISVEDEVVLWIALCARPLGPAEEVAGG